MSFAEVICAWGMEELTAENAAFMESIMPRYRLEKAGSYVRLSDRYNCIAAYFLLICSITAKAGSRELPRVGVSPTGKPYFSARGAPCFNLSHCSGAVCCGVSSREIGVDIQDPIRDKDSILSFAMSLRERKMIYSAEDQAMVCAGLWSLKEAYLKYEGTGLTEAMRELDFSGLLWKSSAYGQLFTESFTAGRYSTGVFSQVRLTALRSGHINDFIQDFRNNGGMI